MAPVAVGLIERRRECRRAGGGTRWHARAVLRPGQPVTVINICSRAALIESGARLRPGAQSEIRFSGAGACAHVKGRLDRCYVTALEPLRYRGVLIFEQCMEVGDVSSNGGE